MFDVDAMLRDKFAEALTVKDMDRACPYQKLQLPSGLNATSFLKSS